MELNRIYIRYGVAPGEHFALLEGKMDKTLKEIGYVLEADGYDEFVGARCLTYKSTAARVGMSTVDDLKNGI